jgi:UDP-glucose:(heptosyl)LPS alpha-1,3-glucosyltransferase
MAQQLGVADRVHFLGGRHDVPDWMLAADLMAHPARSENTGSVLVEALSFGLPVFATDVCGYAPHILAAQAGKTFPEPFDQTAFDRAFQEALSTNQTALWSDHAWAYAATDAIFGCHERAAEIVLEVATRGRNHAPSLRA